MQPVIDTPLAMENTIQQYAWGSKSAIQKLLGIEPDGRTPWAELWMGAHPKSPSRVFLNGEWIGLDEWIRREPEPVLGAGTAEKFGNTLPYLFKILAAEEPLSIQAHPDAEQARQGFDRENRMGIPVGAPHRNYRDPWPKPELICAVEPFGAMIGFRDPAAIEKRLRQFCPQTLDPQARALAGRPDAGGIRQFFHDLMTLEQNRRQEAIREALESARRQDTAEAGWIVRLHEFYPGDIGVLAPLYLNLVEIEPGSAVFLAPGVLHAYLYGTGMEIMANSDNVLRGGLTRKHVDVAELMAVLRFDTDSPQMLRPEPAGPLEQRFATPAREFVLSIIRVSPGRTYDGPPVHGPEILFCLEGMAEAGKPGGKKGVLLKPGRSVLVPAAAGGYAVIGNAVIYKAAVPA